VEYETGPDDYGGGPSVPTLLPRFSGPVACRIWVNANVSIFNVYFTSFTIYLTYSNYYFGLFYVRIYLVFILLIIYLTVLFVVFCFCISVSKKAYDERCLAREEVEP